MKQALSKTIFAIIYLAIGINHAIAADEPMTLTMSVAEQIEVVDAKGNRSQKLIPAEKIIPGDTVIYTTAYHYSGKQAADNVVITNIIPKEVTYLAGSAKGSQTITYSIDGGKHFDQEENLNITTTDGKSRPAKANDYTHIRWLLPHVNSGATGKVSFLSKVNED